LCPRSSSPPIQVAVLPARSPDNFLSLFAVPAFPPSPFRPPCPPIGRQRSVSRLGNDWASSSRELHPGKALLPSVHQEATAPPTSVQITLHCPPPATKTAPMQMSTAGPLELLRTASKETSIRPMTRLPTRGPAETRLGRVPRREPTQRFKN
jgi:hypothetical protein